MRPLVKSRPERGLWMEEVPIREPGIEVKRRLRMKEGLDVGLEMSGGEAALIDRLATVGHGGRIALPGLPERPSPVDWNLIILNGLTLKGIRGGEISETWYKMTVT